MIKTHGVSGNTLVVSVYDHSWTDAFFAECTLWLDPQFLIKMYG